MIRLAKSHIIAKMAIFGFLFALMGCSSEPENPSLSAKQQIEDEPMSAAPADSKAEPIVISEAVTEKTESTEPTSVTATADAELSADIVEDKAVDVVEADNSEMESISENDEVIDSEPASPDAPTASEPEPKQE